MIALGVLAGGGAAAVILGEEEVKNDKRLKL